MTFDQADEEILLQSNDNAPNEPSPESFNNVTHQLIQVQKWKHFSLGAQILDNKFLFVQKYQNRRKTKYWVNLSFVNPAPRHEKQLNWRWGLGAFIGLLVSALLIAIDHYFQVSSQFSYFPSFIVASITASLICIVMMIYKYKNSLLFSTLNGSLVILPLVYNNPSKEEFQKFINNLSKCISQLQEQQSPDQSNRLAIELAEHRRLKETAIISPQEYDLAKNRILSRY